MGSKRVRSSLTGQGFVESRVLTQTVPSVQQGGPLPMADEGPTAVVNVSFPLTTQLAIPATLANAKSPCGGKKTMRVFQRRETFALVRLASAGEGAPGLGHPRATKGIVKLLQVFEG